MGPAVLLDPLLPIYSREFLLYWQTMSLTTWWGCTNVLSVTFKNHLFVRNRDKKRRTICGHRSEYKCIARRQHHRQLWGHPRKPICSCSFQEVPHSDLCLSFHRKIGLQFWKLDLNPSELFYPKFLATFTHEPSMFFAFLWYSSVIITAISNSEGLQEEICHCKKDQREFPTRFSETQGTGCWALCKIPQAVMARATRTNTTGTNQHQISPELSGALLTGFALGLCSFLICLSVSTIRRIMFFCPACTDEREEVR